MNLSSEKTDKILARIKKCLAIAEDNNNNNAEEAAVAASMAAKLMEKYQIDESEVILEDLKSSDNVGEETIDEVAHVSWPLWLQGLIIICADLYECKAMFIKDPSSKQKKVKIVGYKPDVTVAVWTFSYLRSELERLAQLEIKKVKNVKYVDINAKTVKNSFLKGAISSIKQRVNVMLAERKNSVNNNSRSLVVAKQSAIAEKYGDIGYKKDKSFSVDDHFYMQGKEAGDSVNINRPIDKDNNDEQ
jgi:hypothetical protein